MKSCLRTNKADYSYDNCKCCFSLKIFQQQDQNTIKKMYALEEYKQVNILLHKLTYSNSVLQLNIMSIIRRGSLNAIRNKINSERTLIENLVFMDTNEYCDTITLSENLLS